MLRRFHEKFWKIAGLHAGFAKAQGDVIITMDADLQDSPEKFWVV
jgi:glycosyltransferase involved in cell wall biosynthesis